MTQHNTTYLTRYPTLCMPCLTCPQVELLPERTRLRIRVSVLEESVRSYEVECKASRETVMRLVAEVARERRNTAGSAEALDLLRRVCIHMCILLKHIRFSLCADTSCTLLALIYIFPGQYSLELACLSSVLLSSLLCISIN